MNLETKERLEQLKRENKAKIAKKQLIEDLVKYYEIDISNETFVDYAVSEMVRIEVYKKIRSESITVEKFKYEYKAANDAMNRILKKFKRYENENIFFYPSAFRYRPHSCNNLYLDFPIAIQSSIKMCEDLITKLLHEAHDDLIIADDNLRYGFVISEDEYGYVTIEYWGYDNETAKDRKTYSWEIDYGILLGTLTAFPFIAIGFSELLYLTIGASIIAISYSTKRKTHYWLEIWEGNLKYSKTRENISKYEFEETFMDCFVGKEIELKEVESVKFSILRSFIDVRLKSGQKITIDLLTKPSKLKNNIFGELSKKI